MEGKGWRLDMDLLKPDLGVSARKMDESNLTA
jgi:hypothetical protein